MPKNKNQRAYENQCTDITEVGQHLADNPTCAMSFEDVQVLAYENKCREETYSRMSLYPRL